MGSRSQAVAAVATLGQLSLNLESPATRGVFHFPEILFDKKNDEVRENLCCYRSAVGQLEEFEVGW